MGAEGARVGAVLRGGSGRSGDEGGLVFVSEEGASERPGSALARSGVFDGGGGVGFPLSSGGAEKT